MKSFTQPVTPAAPGEGFDPRSGSVVERALFNHRIWVLVLCALVTLDRKSVRVGKECTSWCGSRGSPYT